MSEREWTDKFGTHFEVTQIGHDGRIHSRKITRDPYAGWTITWDEVRQSVEDSVFRALSTHASREGGK